jgi:asparagine synthase (glutamine-hydrolysing)
MCGLAGVAGTLGPPSEDTLKALAAALAHRGPDGRHWATAGSVGVAHSRLAIIDRAGGDQPLHHASGALLVANGEIYNDPALRQSLAGTAFRTGSDCEGPLHLYARQGEAFADSLRGMYAIAVVDPAADRLVLARDPFGIKPLYLAETGNGVAFASEPQALVAAGLVKPVLDEEKRDELLQLQFTTGARTPFAGILRVRPGETLVIEHGHIVSTRRRPAVTPPTAPLFAGEDEAVAALDSALMDSVEVHQRSEVPYGMFLSGGVDSSAILALMARLNDRPVRAYTAGFPGTGVADERAHARAVAGAVGAEHVEVAVTEEDVWRWLPRIVEAVDDPCADYAIVPTWLLGRAARRDGVPVILSGEGGDELFAGYGRYRSARRPWPFAKRPRRRGNFDGLDVLRRPPIGWRDGMAAAERAAADSYGSAVKRAQAVDMADWLPNDLLIKLDRCLMAHGVEGRVPFLDPAVAQVAMRLPDGMALRGRLGKHVLRRWLASALPESRPFAPKTGFSVPVRDWIAGCGQVLGPLVAASPGIVELAHPDRVAALFQSTGKRQGFAAWTLLVHALWFRRHILGQSMEGDVFHVLTTPP